MSSAPSADCSTPTGGFFRRIWLSLKKTFAKAKKKDPQCDELSREAEMHKEEDFQDDGMIHRLLKGANIGSRNRKYSIVLVHHAEEPVNLIWNKLTAVLRKLKAKREPPPPSPARNPSPNPRIRNDSVRSERLVDFQRLPNIDEYVY